MPIPECHPYLRLVKVTQIIVETRLFPKPWMGTKCEKLVRKDSGYLHTLFLLGPH